MIEINGIYCLEGDTHITNDIRRTGTLKWDPTFEKVLQLIGAGNGRRMVDVGAYIGDSTKWFEDAGFKCHAFEPMPDAFECLEKNAHPDTFCHNVAIGSGQTYGTTTESEGNLGGRSLIVSGGGTIAPSLDFLFPDSIDVLKIDAEGFEPFILEGAKEILKKKPIVIIEINQETLARFGFTQDDVLKHLEDYEFEEVYRYGDGQYDLVCKPKEQKTIRLICGRYGDIYQVASNMPPTDTIACSKKFSRIVKELFPQMSLIELDVSEVGLAEAHAILSHSYPKHRIVVCQQNGQSEELTVNFRSYQAFQEYYASI